MNPPEEAAAETALLLERVRAGDRRALDQLLARHRSEIHRFVDLRLDPKLLPRLDASDVVQETQMELARRMDDFLQRQPMPFHLWLRKTAHEHLLRMRRRHIGAANRSVAREISLPDHSSLLLVQKALGRAAAPPGQELAAAEMVQQVRLALADLDDLDREVLMLRLFDDLSNHEAAQVLDLEPAIASKRYGRALLRLRQALPQDQGHSS